MNNQTLEITGAWLVTIGTIIYAIGSTPLPFIQESTLEDFVLVGNTLQAAGNVLEAEGQDEFSLETLGNELQATGNVVSIAGLLLPLENEDEQRTLIAGSWIQALGCLVALSDEITDYSNIDDVYLINGNLLQAIGNSLQAESSTVALKKELQEHLNNSSTDIVYLTGVWLQTIGSILALIGQLKEEHEETVRYNPATNLSYAGWFEQQNRYYGG